MRPILIHHVHLTPQAEHKRGQVSAFTAKACLNQKPNGSLLKSSLREEGRGTLRWAGVGWGLVVGVGVGWGGVVWEGGGCHAVTLLPELAVQLCVLRVYTRDGIIDNG